MASERLDTAEKIVRMTEWNEGEPWEYAEGEQWPADTLASAKRFVSAQAFLLSWQEGKVPTGWRRARRLADFDGKYPQQVLDAASATIAQRIAERNTERTARINAALTATKGRDSASSAGDGSVASDMAGQTQGDGEKIDKKGDGAGVQRNKFLSKTEVAAVKKDFTQFSHHLFEAKSALRTASNAAADAILRTRALSAALQ